MVVTPGIQSPLIWNNSATNQWNIRHLEFSPMYIHNLSVPSYPGERTLLDPTFGSALTQRCQAETHPHQTRNASGEATHECKQINSPGCKRKRETDKLHATLRDTKTNISAAATHGCSRQINSSGCKPKQESDKIYATPAGVHATGFPVP